MENWRKVWREGFVPHISTGGLRFLLAALESDDSRVVQGATTTPPPLLCAQDWPCEAGDALVATGVEELGGWEKATVGECEEYFAKLCFLADQTLGEPAACRWFLNWWDDTPRDKVREELAEEAKENLKNRVAF
jgi:hypothetical protein